MNEKNGDWLFISEPSLVSSNPEEQRPGNELPVPGFRPTQRESGGFAEHRSALHRVDPNTGAIDCRSGRLESRKPHRDNRCRGDQHNGDETANQPLTARYIGSWNVHDAMVYSQFPYRLIRQT